MKLPLFAGPKATGLKRSGSTNATKATGAFTAIKRMVRTTYYQVRFAIPAVVAAGSSARRLPPTSACRSCVTSTVGGFTVISNILRVTFRK